MLYPRQFIHRAKYENIVEMLRFHLNSLLLSSLNPNRKINFIYNVSRIRMTRWRMVLALI